MVGMQSCIPCAYGFYLRYMTHGLDARIADEIYTSQHHHFQSGEEREDWPSVEPRDEVGRLILLRAVTFCY
jgi:hypothetical protein